MKRLKYAVSALSTATILRSVCMGALVLLFTLLLGSPPASAKPRATSGNCDFTTIDASKVAACEDKCDSCRVACVASGEAFCCSANSLGGLDCESLNASSAGLKGVEAALARISKELQNLQIKLDQPNVCAAPDFLPLGFGGQTSPTSFCQLGGPENTLLLVQVYNQGAPETDLSGTETRVVFNTLIGGVAGQVQWPNPDALNTPPLPSGGSQIVEVPIPTGCFASADEPLHPCSFTIAVNATDTATPNELIITNNTVSGQCDVIY